MLNGQGEIVEAEAMETSPVIGKPLREAELPAGIRIGAMVREGEVHIPDGATRILAGDKIVLFVHQVALREVEKLFRVSLEYF